MLAKFEICGCFIVSLSLPTHFDLVLQQTLILSLFPGQKYTSLPDEADIRIASLLRQVNFAAAKKLMEINLTVMVVWMCDLIIAQIFTILFLFSL